MIYCQISIFAFLNIFNQFLAIFGHSGIFSHYDIFIYFIYLFIIIIIEFFRLLFFLYFFFVGIQK